MPELPEVEVLVRHLEPLLRDHVISGIQIRRKKIIAPFTPRQFNQRLRGARFKHVSRRGKFLVFELQAALKKRPLKLIGHLGMTGRMYLLPGDQALPKHAAVILKLKGRQFVYEDTRYFGRLTFDASALDRLGPEPLDKYFTARGFANQLRRSAQAIKVKLLDQSLVAGIGNIYASEALFLAGIRPTVVARKLTDVQVRKLWRAIRQVLREAIRFGSTVPLDWAGQGSRDGLFYYGQNPDAPDYYDERLRVYDRASKPCSRCSAKIRRLVQTGRSTFYCPNCQKAR